MAQIKTLPLLPGAKFIVIDDGLEVTRADSLIAGWLQMWNDKGLGNAVEFLLFSNPKFVYEKHTEQYKNIDLKFHDYYTTIADRKDWDEVAQLDCIHAGNVLQINSVVIIDCLSSLVLNVGLAKALQFVEKLSSWTAQLICIYRRDFGQHRVPRIETLGTTYIRLDKALLYGFDRDYIKYEVSLNHRKQSGGILTRRAQICQEYAKNTYEIIREELPTSAINNEPIAVGSLVHEEPQATFRMEMNAREQEQRKNTPLPYGLNPGSPNKSQILYKPNSIDDLDEEDPDDDLPF